MKTLTLKVYEKLDRYNDYVRGHEIYYNEGGVSIDFDAYNLNECPEDAIIGRDLFDAYDYIRALNKGIELAKMGYDQVDSETISEIEKF